MEQELEQALAFAQYQQTFNNQRQLIKERFQEQTLLAHNGGLLRVTPQLIATLGAVPELEWLEDMNGNPVRITDVDQLRIECVEVWNKAAAQWGSEFQDLKRRRSVKALTDL